MKNELTTTITKLNWHAIINNCTDKRFWKQTWTIFDYGRFKLEMHLSSINVRDNSVSITIHPVYFDYDAKHNKRKAEKYSSWYNGGDDVSMSLNMDPKNYNENVFNKALLSTCLSAMESRARREVLDSVQYKKFQEADIENDDNAERIATNFLDINKITDEDLRDAYIDTYKDKVRTNFAFEYSEAKKKTMFASDKVALCYFLEQPDRIDSIKNAKKCNLLGIRTAVKKQLSSEHVKEMESELVEI